MKSLTMLGVCSAVLLGSFAGGVVLLAQDEPIRVDVNLVSILASVRGKSGALISDLKQDDFKIYEDGKEQRIKNFTRETDLPLTIGLLVDTSASQERLVDTEQRAASQFFSKVLRPKDQAFLIQFGAEAELLQDLTNSARSLQQGLKQLRLSVPVGGLHPGPVPTMQNQAGTILYDAVYLAAHDKLAQETGRKALIVLSDGEDQGSEKKLEDAIEAAQRANSLVYVLLIADRPFYGRGIYTMGYTGDIAMKKLAEATGGRLIDVGNNGKKMEAAFAAIEQELRTEYVASYTPTNAKLDGSYRKIDMDVKGDGLKAQVRKGYYAVPQTE